MKYLPCVSAILLGVMSLTSIVSTVVAAETKPNLIFIVTDEHNFRTLGCYRELLPQEQAEIWGPGNVVETPHLDAIAQRGTLFNRMYASAPVCTPARASMFTGMYGHQLGIPNNSNKPGDGKYLRPGVPTIAQCLRDAGYMTGYIGKWHLAEARSETEKEWWSPYPVGRADYDYGFSDRKFMFNGGHDKYKGIDQNGTPYFSHLKDPKPVGLDAAGQPLYQDDKSDKVKYATDWLTDRTIEFIGANKAKPFYCVCSIPDPHTPDTARQPYLDMYKDMNFQLPRTYEAAHAKDLPKWQQPDGKAKDIQEHLSHYFGMVKCIDDNVGRIVKKLEEEGIAENTIVVFTSDHGDLMFEHARMNKGTIHETSARVPFLIAHGKDVANPLVPRGKVIQEAANTTDWMPTLLALLGVKCPQVPGRDLTPLLADKKPSDWNDITFSKLGFVAAIDSRYKLHLTVKGEPWLLDIQADPDELKNFIHDPAYENAAQRLARELKGFMKRCDAENGKLEAKLDEILSR